MPKNHTNHLFWRKRLRNKRKNFTFAATKYLTIR